MRIRIVLPLLIVVALAGTAIAQQRSDNPVNDDPETVVDTLHVKAGKEDELARVMARA
jgi:hypothetical protein